jgi:hypothetical protein
MIFAIALLTSYFGFHILNKKQRWRKRRLTSVINNKPFYLGAVNWPAEPKHRRPQNERQNS